MTIFAKDLFAPLRRLKRVTWAARRIVDALNTSPFSNMVCFHSVLYVDCHLLSEIDGLSTDGSYV